MLEIYLPHTDVLQSLKVLTNEDLVYSIKCSNLVLKTLEKMNVSRYQLSGGLKGTIVQNRNGTICYSNSPVTLFWEHAVSNLITYFNMGLLLACQKGLAVGKTNPISMEGLFKLQTKAFFNEYALESRQTLLRKNYDYYKGKFDA